MQTIIPEVSVIIPSYQNGDVLPRAVRSVLAQSFKNFEVIIINNASTDNTSQVCKNLEETDSRIHWIFLETNLGPAGARNAGVAKTQGKYIAFLDADDEWLENKLETQVMILNSFPDITLVFCDGYLRDEKLDKQKTISKVNKIFKKKLNFTEIDHQKPIFRISGDVQSEIYRGNFINLSGVILRKEKFTEFGGFDQKYYGIEDLDLWVKLAKDCHFAYWYERKIICHWRSDSLSRINEARIKELLKFHIRYHQSEEFRNLRKAALDNIYYCYKLLILFYANQWQPFRAFAAFNESLRIRFYPSLLVYAILSIFGKIPVEIKIKMINPIIKKKPFPDETDSPHYLTRHTP